MILCVNYISIKLEKIKPEKEQSNSLPSPATLLPSPWISKFVQKKKIKISFNLIFWNVANTDISKKISLSFYDWVIFHCICIPHTLYSSLDRHLGCLQVLAIVNNAAMNIGVPVSFQINAFLFLRQIPRSGIAGLYDNSNFSLLRHLRAVFHNGYTTSHSQQQCTRVPFSPYPHQGLFVVFWIMALPIDAKWFSLWKDLDGFMLSEIGQAEKGNTIYYRLYVKSIKWNKWMAITKEKQTHRYRKQTRGYQWWEGMGEGQDRDIQPLPALLRYVSGIMLHFFSTLGVFCFFQI